MSLSDEDRAEVDSFLDYVADFSDSDDRYGLAVRLEREDESLFATRFEVGPSAWLEVGVWPSVPEVRIGVVTDEPATGEEIVAGIEADDVSLTDALAAALVDAGLNWPEPPIEKDGVTTEEFRLTTPIELEELSDLDVGFLDVRDKSMRLLEAYLNVFAATFLSDGDDEFEDYDEDEEDE